MKHLLIIDGKYLCYVALFSRQGLVLEGKPIGILYGFWHDLFSDIKKLSPTHLFVAWDSPRSFRAEIYPEYKQGRKTKESELRKRREDFGGQISAVRDSLSKAGISQQELPGLEADDLIALQCRAWEGRITVHSADSDLYQLLSKDVDLYAKRKKFTLNSLRQKWGCTPEEWAAVKALAGCPGDNVEGVKGIAEKTAIKIIQGRHKSKSLSDFEEVTERNYDLVKLPFPLVDYKKISLKGPDRVSDIDYTFLKTFFMEKQFYSLLDTLKTLIR